MAATGLNSWLLAAIKASKSPSIDHVRQLENTMEGYEITDPFSEHDPNFRRLVEGVYFTRRFMVTYHVVLVGIVAVFAIVHWTKNFRRSKRYQKTNLEDTILSSPTSSASSSTYTGSFVGQNRPRKQIADENSPLLAQSHRAYSISGLRARTRSWLMYQPRPIPLLNKELPSNGTSVIVILLIALEIFYLFFGYHIEKNTIFLFGDRCGALFVGNLPWLYILSAKVQPVKVLTGFSYESLNILHRRLGEFLCLLAVFHLLAMVGVWYTILYPLGYSFAWYLSEKIVILGILAFVTYETLYLTSLRSFRNRFYEFFLNSHVLLQFAALFFVFFHHPQARILVPIAMAIFLADRVIFRWLVKSWTAEGTLHVAEDGDTVIVTVPAKLRKPLSPLATSLLPLSLRHAWKTSQHIFLTIRDIGGVQSHPFSIASPPPTTANPYGELQLIVRSQNGFSRQLLEYAKSHDSATMELYGPYGSLQALEMLRHKDMAVIFAAGSGIAVAYPFVRALADDSCRKQKGDVDNQTRSMHKRICLIWVRREESHKTWIPDEDWASLQADGVDIVIPPPTSKHGRPDSAVLLEEAVKSRLTKLRRTVGVVCSGPDPVNRSIRNISSRLAAEGIDIDISIEKYGW